MNVETMNNDTIQIDQISSEQHLHIGNHQGENSTQINTKSKEVDNGTNKMKKTPMTPTRLYVSFSFFSIIISIFD
jgi:hypothetical protein